MEEQGESYATVDSETSESDSDDEVFHEEELVVISSTDKINMLQWSEHLEENWERLTKESTRLLVLAGVHGREDGELGGNETKGKGNFVEDSERQLGRLRKKFKDKIQKRNIELAVRDVGSHRERCELDEDKFVLSVKEFQPTMILLAFCWSHKSELNDLLRAAGIYSTLILREELAQITESRHVYLDKDQKELIEKIAEEEPRGLLLWGTSGSGKTLLAAEALKMMISQLKRKGEQEIQVIVTSMMGQDPLMQDLKHRYLPGIQKDCFLKMNELTQRLGVVVGLDEPKSMIKNIMDQLSTQMSQSPSHTILLIDEVYPVSKEEQSKDEELMADWTSLKTKEGVHFILSFSTFSTTNTFFNVTLPTDKEILCQKLTVPHRNCAEIAKLFQFQIQHLGRAYLAGTEHDRQAVHLPPGRLPIWVERSKEVTDEEVFDFINRSYMTETKFTVTVCLPEEPRERAEKWCIDHGWKYLEKTRIVGNRLSQLTTAHHLLFEKKGFKRKFMPNLQSFGQFCPSSYAMCKAVCPNMVILYVICTMP